MTLPKDLLAQARLLAEKEPRRPKQASLRRAVSTAYYALFRLLVDDGSRRLMGGANRTALRSCLARAFKHATMNTVAKQFAEGGVSPKLIPGLNGEAPQNELNSVASVFIDLQQQRHEADYDMRRRFTRIEVLSIVDDAERAFRDWRTVRGSAQADTFLVGLLAFDRMHL